MLPENLRALPTVQGIANQFQIKRSRYGDQVHLLIDGGRIKELVFLDGDRSSEAPVGFIVMQNNGRLGLGPADRDTDSVNASVVLGVNGVTLVANGDGIVDLNGNILVNNVCPILAGPDFGQSGEQHLVIQSVIPTEFRVTAGGILDLCSFTGPNQVLEFAGEARLVLEEGAILAMGGGTLLMNDKTSIVFN